MKNILMFLSLFAVLSCLAQTHEKEDKEAILHVMKLQEEAWSNNDLDGFMQGYWKSDSLKFFGSSGLTKGWRQTLDNYKRAYPTKEHLGKLTFKINDISKITECN